MAIKEDHTGRGEPKGDWWEREGSGKEYEKRVEGGGVSRVLKWFWEGGGKKCCDQVAVTKRSRRGERGSTVRPKEQDDCGETNSREREGL